MTSYVDWGNVEETLLIMKFDSKWTYEDYRSLVEEALQQLDDKDHPVDLFIDLQFTYRFPKNLIHIMRGSSRFKHPNTRNVVVISSSTFVAKMYMVVKGIIPNFQPIRLAKNSDEAYAHLEEVNQTKLVVEAQV